MSHEELSKVFDKINGLIWDSTPNMTMREVMEIEAEALKAAEQDEEAEHYMFPFNDEVMKALDGMTVRG